MNLSVQIRSNTSSESIKQMCNALENEYISTRYRQLTVKHLKLVIQTLEDAKDETLKEFSISRAHQLVRVFEQSTFKKKYITSDDRSAAQKYIGSLERYFTGEGIEELEKSMEQLDLKDKRPIILQRLLIHDTLSPIFMDVLAKDLQVFQTSVGLGTHKVSLFGKLPSEDFWKQFESVRSVKLVDLPPTTDIKQVVEYYGGFEGGSFIDQVLMAGSSLKSCNIKEYNDINLENVILP